MSLIKILLLGVFVTVAANPDADAPPSWTNTMGSINCNNANYEVHYVRDDCEVTYCIFGNNRSLLFLSCPSIDTQVQCVYFGEQGNCPVEEIVF